MDQVSDDGSRGGMAICQRCGHDTRKDVLEVSETDKKEYVRCVLGRRPFTKRFSFLGGALSLTLADMPLGESFAADAVLMEAGSQPELKGMPAGMALLSVYVRELEASGVPGQRWEGPPTTVEGLLERIDALNKVFPASLAQPLSSAYTIFKNTLASLSEDGLDKNF